jgi:hypothetical protein
LVRYYKHRKTDLTNKMNFMKKIIPFLSIAVLLTACGNNAKNDSAAITPVDNQAQSIKTDTSGLAEYQMWKLQQQIAEVETPAEPAVQYASVAPVKKVKKTYRPAVKVTEQAPETSASTSESNTNSAGDVGMSSESSNAAEAPEKKGWSKAAKGAVIGGATGAAAGAVINKKNRAVGAVIGGVVGAGAGVIIGRDMDKKDGRY